MNLGLMYFGVLGLTVGAFALVHRQRRVAGEKLAPVKEKPLVVAHIFTTSELAGAVTTVHLDVGHTVIVRAAPVPGGEWRHLVQQDAAGIVQVRQLPEGDETVFYITAARLGKADVTLTALGPRGQVITSVGLVIDVIQE